MIVLTARCFVLYCLVVVMMTGFATVSYAQPMFPPQINREDTSEPTLADASQTAVNPTRQNFNNNELLAFAGIHLVNAIKALQSGDTNTLNSNLNVSQHQFEEVIGPAEISELNDENKSVASGGIQLISAIRALQSADATALNNDLNNALERFAEALGVSPEVFVRLPASTGATTDQTNNNTQQTAGDRVPSYTDNELLAYGGIHLVNAIKALQSGDTDSAENNLITSEQQFWSARYPN